MSEDKPAYKPSFEQTLPNALLFAYGFIAVTADGEWHKSEDHICRSLVQGWLPKYNPDELIEGIININETFTADVKRFERKMRNRIALDLFRKQIIRLKDALPIMSRVALLEDLILISVADGKLTQTELKLLMEAGRLLEVPSEVFHHTLDAHRSRFVTG